MEKPPEIVHRTVGPWWVGGRGFVYEETYILADGRVMTRKQYEGMYLKNEKESHEGREDRKR